jgi:hypothetical protein
VEQKNLFVSECWVRNLDHIMTNAVLCPLTILESSVISLTCFALLQRSPQSYTHRPHVLVSEHIDID